MAKRSAAGDLAMLSVTERKLYRVSTSGSVQTTSLSDVPELRSAESHSFIADLAIDSGGRTAVPTVWHHRPASHRGKHFASGVTIFAPSGSYAGLITFNPSPEVRRVAMDRDGFIYALGMESAYLRGQVQECLLVHKFAPDGKRLTAFSECPDNAGHQVRQGINLTANPAFQRLKQETDYGHLWVAGGLVHHVLPLSHLLRVFDSSGILIRETILTPPEDEIIGNPFPLPAPVEERLIFAFFPMTGARYLAQWRISAGQHKRSYYAVHGLDGKAVSRATFFYRTMPVGVDESGAVYFLREVAGSQG